MRFPRWQEARSLGSFVSSRLKPPIRIWVSPGQVRLLKANGQFVRLLLQKTSSVDAALIQTAELIQHFVRDNGLTGHRLSLYLSDAFASPVLIPVPAIGLTLKEQKEVVQRHYKRLMGKTSHDWHCTWISQVHHMLAMALPAKTWHDLMAAFDAVKCPLFSAKSISYELLQQDFWSDNGWAVVSDDDELTLAYLHEGQLHALKSFTSGLASDEERLSVIQRQLAISQFPQKSLQWLDLRVPTTSKSQILSSMSQVFSGFQRLHPSSYPWLHQVVGPREF